MEILSRRDLLLNDIDKVQKKPHLVWIYDANQPSLGVTTRLEITRELRRMGWYVTLILEGTRGLMRQRRVDVHCIPKPRIYLMGYALFHLRVIKFLLKNSENIDAVLFHQMSAIWLLPLTILRNRRESARPVFVMDTRDLNPTSKDLKTNLRIKFYKFSHRLANRWADGQTAITNRMAELVNIPPQHLWGIWSSGVDPDKFVRATSSRKWPSRSDPVTLIYIGLLHNERNLIDLCQAVEDTNAKGLNYKLLLIGEGRDRPALEQFAAQTDGRVRVDPPVAYEDVPETLSKGHIGVLPYPNLEKHNVSSPIKLFEYMASGLPVLVTPIPCHTDVIKNGAYAFWSKDASVESLSSTLEQIWRSRSILSEMGRGAALASDNWTWKGSATMLRAALEYGLEIESLMD